MAGAGRDDGVTVDPELLARMVRDSIKQQTSEDAFASSPEHSALIRRLLASLQERHEFKIGQFVRWKDGLKNRTLPNEGVVGIVVELLADPVYPDRDTGSAYYREPLDMALGLIIGEERQFGVYWFDSRRFEPAPQQ